jgi:hypothetical protein
MSVATKPAFRFDGKNPTAQRVAARQAAAMVTRIARETRAAIRDLIVRSIRDGIPVYDAARLIRGMVGMNGPQAAAALAYRAQLIDSGLSIAKVDVLVDRYVEKKIAERADTIARFEVMDALNEGARESYRQAQDDGLLTAQAVKEWIVTPDDLLCAYCAPMDGVQVALGASFQTELGKVDGPPLHPNCRCTQAVTEPDR